MSDCGSARNSYARVEQRWTMLSWSQAMAMVEYAAMDGTICAACGVLQADARALLDAMAKYSYVYAPDYGNGSGLTAETPVRMTLFRDEARTLGRLWHHLMAGGMPGLVLPSGLDNKHVEALRAKADAYAARQAAARTRDHDECLEAIRVYVKDCRKNGKRISKKQLAGQTRFSYEYVKTVWKEFDEEQEGVEIMSSYQWAIEEMALSGAIGLGPCSRSTVYRWAKECNAILEREKAEWRVKPDVKNRALKSVLVVA